MNNSSHKLYKKALFLEYLTITWNVLEGVISMALGLLAGSVSLFAYGLESSVEVFASSVTVWELKGTGKGREKKALKMIGWAYLVVSAYVFFDAIQSLFAMHHPSSTPLGIIFLIVTVLVMLVLGVLKQNVGKKMNQPVVLADAKFTLIDGALSATVLIGLLLNTLFGWWWTDQALALFLAGAAFREGLKEIL
jgi:divalent metal cation (Fe/Co/Zn/Cd) transporter